MPKWMCLSCIREINRCYAFKIKCENSNNNLLQLLHESDGTDEIISEMATRNGEECATNAIDKFKKETIDFTVQEIDEQLKEFESDPEESTQRNAPKFNDMYDPLEADSKTFRARDFQDIDLINAVKQHQCIYNTEDRDYKSYPKRRRAWQKISKEVKMPGRYNCSSPRRTLVK